DLLVGKWPHFLSKDDDDAKSFAVLEHRHCENAANTAQFYGGDALRMALGVCAGRGEIGSLGWPLGPGRLAYWSTGDGAERTSLPYFDKRRGDIVRAAYPKNVTLAEIEQPEPGPAQPYRIIQQGRENGLQLSGRAGDDFEHLGGCRPLLQRLAEIGRALAQFIEEAGILDGDYGLGGEIREQLDLLLCERPHFLAVDDDRADQVVILEHGHGEKRPRAAFLDGGDANGIAFPIRLLCAKIANVDRSSGLREATKTGARIRPPQSALQVRSVGRRNAEESDGFEGLVDIPKQNAELGLTDADCIVQHSLKHRLELAREARDDAQHLRCRGLLLQRLAEIGRALAQLIEESRVLDGDDGLPREARHQLNLLVAKRTDLLAVDADGADQLIFLEHGNGEDRAVAAVRNGGDEKWGARDIGRQLGDVGDLRGLFGFSRPPEAGLRGWTNDCRACLGIGRRCVVHRQGAETIAFAEIERAELGLANAHRIAQHGREHRLQIAGRTGNDPQHLRCRGLLLQRLAEVGRALAQLVEQPRILDGDDGLSGKARDQRDLLLAEWAHFLTVDADHTN